jgi:hypothetical protein
LARKPPKPNERNPEKVYERGLLGFRREKSGS